jgi:hypothetical protein
MTRPVEEVLRIEDLAVSQNGSEESSREAALQKELEGVRNLNSVMEGVIAAMTKAKDNMDVPSQLDDVDVRLLEPQWKTQINYSTYGLKS